MKQENKHFKLSLYYLCWHCINTWKWLEWNWLEWHGLFDPTLKVRNTHHLCRRVFRGWQLKTQIAGHLHTITKSFTSCTQKKMNILRCRFRPNLTSMAILGSCAYFFNDFKVIQPWYMATHRIADIFMNQIEVDLNDMVYLTLHSRFATHTRVEECFWGDN